MSEGKELDKFEVPIDGIVYIESYPLLIKKGTILYGRKENFSIYKKELERSNFPVEFRYDKSFPEESEGDEWEGKRNE